MDDDLNTLKQVPLLRSLSESELAALAPRMRFVEIEAGEIIFEQGAQGDTLYFIRKGRVQFTFRHDTGHTDTFEESGPGHFFGEVAVFTVDGVRTATAKVVDTLEAYTLDRRELKEFLRDHPDAALHLLSGMAERLRRSGRQLQQAPVRNVNAIIAETLTARDRVAQGLARFFGSPSFLILHAVVYSYWIVVNRQKDGHTFDPYPYALLALIAAIEALAFSCFVLMNQYREDGEAAKRNDVEFQINTETRQAISYLHERLDDLGRELVTRLPEPGEPHHADNAPKH